MVLLPILQTQPNFLFSDRSMKINRLTDLNNRLTVSLGAVCIIAILIAFASSPFVSVLIALALSGLTATAVWEYAKLAHAKDLKPATMLMVVVAVCFVLSFFISLVYPSLKGFPQIIFVLGAIAFFIYHFKDPAQALVHIAVELFSIVYLAIPLSLMLAILYPSWAKETIQEGRWWFVYLIAVTKMTDVGAYFVGRLMGKRKLAPVLSPKKTIEGAIAGFMMALLMSLFIRWVGHFSQGAFTLSLFDALWLGSLIGIMGQIGDLAESLLKRDAVVKDSNTLPGLGGVLDMVDSLLFTAPTVYFFMKIHS